MKVRRLILILLIGLIPLSGAGWYAYYRSLLPNRIQVIAGDHADFNFSIPASAQVEETDTSWTLQQPFTMTAWDTGSYEMKVRLFGVIPLKTVQVQAVEEAYVIPCGCPVGIYLETQGVMVIDTGEVTDADGTARRPADNILQSGDYIQMVNGTGIEEKEQLIQAIQESQGEPVILTVQRNENEIQVQIIPIHTADGSYKAGIWVRDDMQGIGTLTYATEDTFAALGHGVNDMDTGRLVELDSGELRKASVLGVRKGTSGTPGSVTGTVDYTAEGYLGEIQANAECGITGTLDRLGSLPADIDRTKVPIALKQEVTAGTAYLRSDISGEMKDYEIQITEIHLGEAHTTKGMELKVTDPELIELTGGIIQGMSGSPILQDGKLVGAVTHVFVNDPTRGYGIFIENML